MNDIKKGMMNRMGFEGFGIQFINPKKVLVKRVGEKEELIENVDSIDIIKAANITSIEINYNVSEGSSSSTATAIGNYENIVVLD